MSSALLDRPSFALRRAGELPAGGGRPTLAERLDETLRATRAGDETGCPICHASMRPLGEAARCESCGTTLS